MTQLIDEKKVTASTKLINAKNVTIIPNSRAEHSIYTYSTKVDTYADIKSAAFYNPLYTFFAVGDILRIFKYDKDGLTTYYELVAVDVDKLNKKVTMAILVEKNVKKSIIGE